MHKKPAIQHFDFADSELDSFEFHGENSLTISIKSWDAKSITLTFSDVIHFSYDLGFQISNFYEIQNSNDLIGKALARNYEKIPISHPFKLFQLEDIYDFPFIQIVAESVFVIKE